MFMYINHSKEIFIIRIYQSRKYNVVRLFRKNNKYQKK